MNALRTALFLVPFALAGAAHAASETTEARNVSGFHKIQLRGSIDLRVKEGSSFSVQVVARPDELKKIETTVDGDTLRIRQEDGSHFGFHFGDSGKTEVDVTLPELQELDIHGSGDALSVDLANAHDFALSITGSGDAKVHGPGKAVRVDVTGSGDVELDGPGANALQIAVSGSGDVSAKNYPARDVSVEVHGSGDVSTNVNGGSANFAVSGSGDIEWYGNAANIQQKSHGSGDISHHG